MFIGNPRVIHAKSSKSAVSKSANPGPPGHQWDSTLAQKWHRQLSSIKKEYNMME